MVKNENIEIDNMWAVQLHNVDKDFEVATEYIKIIKDANIDIQKGEFVIITGPSGSGKSTMLHIICGWEEPTAGYLKIDGNNIYEVDEIQRTKALKTKIAFVSQYPSWIGSLNTIENIELPYLLSGNSKKSSRTRAQNLIQMLSLGDLTLHNPADLSGGQQQRVNLLRALINNPEIIIADEPTGNLDSQSSGFVIDLLLLINKRLRRTIIMATHDQELLKHATKIIKISDGKITDTIINDKKFEPKAPIGDIDSIGLAGSAESKKGLAP